MNILTVDNITKSYGVRKIFDGASFFLQEGEKAGIIGINGTGKSTIAKAIQAKVTGNEDGLKQLLPFRYERDADEHQPSISGLEDFHSVQIFNEDYVNQYVYQPDELIKDSFTIFVKTPDYE